MGACLADNQSFLALHFTRLIQQTVKVGRESSTRRTKIIMNYLRRFHQDEVLRAETLQQVWEVFLAEFPAGNKAYKDIHDGFGAILKV